MTKRTLAELYGAQPFDATDPRDARSERARKLLLKAALDCEVAGDMRDGSQAQDVAGGLLIGLVQVISAGLLPTDENHAHLRAALLAMIPWAVDNVRSFDNLPPLSGGTQ